MNRSDYGALFASVIERAAREAEARLGEPVQRRFEIELHGAYHSGDLMSVERALSDIYISDDAFYRIIDVAVIGVSPEKTRVFVRVSGHAPGSFEETWHQFEGLGPFNVMKAARIEQLYTRDG
jgi:hypothetical protein